MLDSDVQGLFGTEELAGDEPISSFQRQWAYHTEFPSVVKLFELNCCSIPVTAAGSGGNFCSTCKSSCRLDFKTQRGEVVAPLADGPSGVAHPSDSCVVVFIELAADLEGQLDIISEVPEVTIRFSPDGRRIGDCSEIHPH